MARKEYVSISIDELIRQGKKIFVSQVTFSKFSGSVGRKKSFSVKKFMQESSHRQTDGRTDATKSIMSLLC